MGRERPAAHRPKLPAGVYNEATKDGGRRITLAPSRALCIKLSCEGWREAGREGGDGGQDAGFRRSRRSRRFRPSLASNADLVMNTQVRDFRPFPLGINFNIEVVLHAGEAIVAAPLEMCRAAPLASG